VHAVDGSSLAAVTLARPLRPERVEAEDAEHGPDLGEAGDGGFLVVGGEGGVPMPHHGVHDGKGLLRLARQRISVLFAVLRDPRHRMNPTPTNPPNPARQN
jgi:hypothetical protein